MRKVHLPDGSIKELNEHTSVYDFAGSISAGLQRAAVGAKLGKRLLGMPDEIDEDGDIKILKFDDKEGKEIFWHTSSHVMALAIKRLWPETKFAIGPSIDAGFYYDLDLDHRLTPEDLEHIEKEMKKIVKEGLPMEKRIVSKQEAMDFFKDQPYKIDLIEHLPEDETISIYKLGDFEDLCRGPHMADVKKIGAIKLLSVAGAYWRGDEKNKMLQRIYGITFEKKKQLDEYLDRLEEAKKRDHRKLGQEMKLFSMHEEGPGFPFFHPRGMVLRNILESFWREEHEREGYGEIRTPIILNESLWRQSGHWDHYKENMYFTKIDDEDYAIKPMNCPGAILIYRTDLHSYRDFPLRLAEMGLVHRHELSGALHGLFRVRSFTQDDAHIFCTPEQLKGEFLNVMDIVLYIFKVLDFQNYDVQISLRDPKHKEKYIGSDENWDRAERAIREAVAERGMKGIEVEGEAAFYGPKLDFMVRDAIGRKWQLGTIQVDYNLPERFGLEYIGADDQRHRPVMIHRAPFGSMERFVAVLIEHTAGRFPLWLAPEQVIVLPVSDKFVGYAERVAVEMKKQDICVTVDSRGEKIGKKIRDAELQRIPYIVVVGEREEQDGTLSVRERGGVDDGVMDVPAFVTRLKEELAKAFAK